MKSSDGQDEVGATHFPLGRVPIGSRAPTGVDTLRESGGTPSLPEGANVEAGQPPIEGERCQMNQSKGEKGDRSKDSGQTLLPLPPWR